MWLPLKKFVFFLKTAEPEENHEEMAELSAAPTAKRPCQCCCQTYSEILSFLEKRSEAEQRLREEELALRREELEIQRSKIFIEQCSVVLNPSMYKNIKVLKYISNPALL